MSDYISREATIEKIRVAGCTDCGGSSGTICRFCDFENAVSLVNGLPAADVEPVRHGQWISLTDCSNAGYIVQFVIKKYTRKITLGVIEKIK